ncbi:MULTISPECIES: sensor histidine kinase [Bacillaceae]|uniref:histidine kinase n=1 Tax=Evansella alkalicola TaxID=745819 RepID=A0ABS6JPS4_9BACI|nr:MULTISPECIES: sensor histidine kinase [Bacillaceae]MBU9720559.1 sensor histidine kinase [Bacillus alkalicola]
MLQDLFVNGFFLLLFCCFIPLILIFRNETIRKRKILLTTTTSAAIIACISFPIQMSNGIFFDLRLVAQIYGSLYGGPIVAIVLTIVNIGYRSLFEGSGVITSLVIAPLHLIVLILIRKWYLSLSLTWKLINITILGLGSSLITISIINYMTQMATPTEIVIYYSALFIFALILVIFSVETIEKQWFIQTKVFQSEKMETVSQLAASISHEIRNPLTSVKGFLQLLQKSELKDKQKKYLEISLTELDRAEEVIRDYLSYAKPDSTGPMMVLNVKEEIDRIINILKPLSNQNSIHIETEVNTHYIKGNPQHFRQCLVNIGKNAIESMETHSKGTLSISTAREESFVYISIKDTGIGMTKNQIARLGEPYYSTKGAKGTGLGTMLVYRYIQKMGGSIKVNSKKGQGTEFIIRLPSAEAINSIHK